MKQADRKTAEQQAVTPTTNSVTAANSSDLLGPAKKLVISHNGENYTLRITSKNKLILTK